MLVRVVKVVELVKVDRMVWVVKVVWLVMLVIRGRQFKKVLLLKMFFNRSWLKSN